MCIRAGGGNDGAFPTDGIGRRNLKILKFDLRNFGQQDAPGAFSIPILWIYMGDSARNADWIHRIRVNSLCVCMSRQAKSWVAGLPRLGSCVCVFVWWCGRVVVWWRRPYPGTGRLEPETGNRNPENRYRPRCRRRAASDVMVVLPPPARRVLVAIGTRYRRRRTTIHTVTAESPRRSRPRPRPRRSPSPHATETAPPTFRNPIQTYDCPLPVARCIRASYSSDDVSGVVPQVKQFETVVVAFKDSSAPFPPRLLVVPCSGRVVEHE